MSRKEEYKLQNEQFLEQLRTAEGIKELPCGILYRVLEEGRDGPTPRLNSVVSVHYKGTLINGREFDNSWKRKCIYPLHHGIRYTYQWTHSGVFHTDI